MRINEIIFENTLSEGPLLNKVGAGIGKAVGGTAKAVGAVAGGVAGIPGAIAKGFRAGKSTVSGAGDEPKSSGGVGAGIAKGLAGGGSTAAGSDAAGDPGAETAAKTLQQQVDKLSPETKQELLKTLQASSEKDQTAAAKPAAQNPDAEPAAKSSTAATPATGAGTATAGTTAAGKPRVEPTLAAPAAAAASTSASAQKTSPAQGQASSDPYEIIKGQVRKAQGGTKPVPDNLLQSINTDIARMGKGDKDMGANVGQRILQLAKQGYDVKNAQTQFIGASKQLTQSVYRAISNMLKEHGLAWSDLNLKITLVEGVSEYVLISELRPLTENKIQLYRVK